MAIYEFISDQEEIANSNSQNNPNIQVEDQRTMSKNQITSKNQQSAKDVIGNLEIEEIDIGS